MLKNEKTGEDENFQMKNGIINVKLKPSVCSSNMKKSNYMVLWR